MSDNFKFVQNQVATLAGSGVSAAATSIILTSFYQIDGTTTLTMTNFGTIGYGTIEPGNATQEEQISFTGITQNANGTATLTGVSTVLFISPYTATSGLAKSHPGGSQFIISNTAGFYNSLTGKDDDETITGTWTFTNPNYPLMDASSPLPTAAAQLATKAYVDSVAFGTTTYDQNIISGVAGESLAAGNLVYFKTSDGRWWLCDADTAATVDGIIMGFAQGTAAAAASLNILIGGIDKNQSGLTAGTVYYASNTAGGLSASAGTTAKVVGQALTTTTFILNQFFSSIPTDSQKAALVGTSGAAPSATNTYIDNSNTSQTGVANKVVKGNTSGVVDFRWLNPNFIKLFTTGEAITVGQAVIVNTGAIIAYSITQSTTDDTTIMYNTSQGILYRGQTFLSNANSLTLTSVQVTLTKTGSTAGYNVRLAVYATSGGLPTGAALGSATLGDASINDGTATTWTFATPITISGSTTYALMAEALNSTSTQYYSILNNTTSVYAGGTYVYSLDQGATWVAGSTQDLKFVVNGTSGTGTSGAIYRSNATSADQYANNFIGFAAATAASGASCSVYVGGIATLASAWNGGVGVTMYLSDTAGAIKATAGSQSRKVGMITAPTQILIKHDNA